MRKTAFVASAAALLTLGACQLIPGEPGEPSQTPRPTPTTPRPTPTPPPEDVPLGQPYRYADGVEIVVTGPEVLDRPYDSTTWEEYAEFEDIPEDADPVKFTMTITNKGEDTLNPTTATMTVLADDRELDAQCFGEGVECGTSLSKLRPGKSVRIAWSYWLPKDAQEITVEVSPSFDHDPALYHE